MLKKIALLISLVMMFSISCVFASSLNSAPVLDNTEALSGEVLSGDESEDLSGEVSGEENEDPSGEIVDEPSDDVPSDDVVDTTDDVSGEEVQSGDETETEDTKSGNGFVIGAIIAVVIVVAVVAIVSLTSKK